jgi:hypothetical protein
MLQTVRSQVWFLIRPLVFSIDLIVAAHYGPGTNSACNRNEHQDSSWDKEWPAHKDDSLITTLFAGYLQNMGASMSHNPMGLHGLLRDSFNIFYVFHPVIL